MRRPNTENERIKRIKERAYWKGYKDGCGSCKENEIERLEDELQEVRRLVVNLLPNNLAKAIYTYKDYEQDQTDVWQYIAIGKIIRKIIEVISDDPATPWTDGFDGKRTPCPLCRDVPNDGYAAGFTQLGLKRHLYGDGKARKCEFMKTIVVPLANTYWNRRVDAQTQSDKGKKARE